MIEIIKEGLVGVMMEDGSIYAARKGEKVTGTTEAEKWLIKSGAAQLIQTEKPKKAANRRKEKVADDGL